MSILVYLCSFVLRLRLHILGYQYLIIIIQNYSLAIFLNLAIFTQFAADRAEGLQYIIYGNIDQKVHSLSRVPSPLEYQAS